MSFSFELQVTISCSYLLFIPQKKCQFQFFLFKTDSLVCIGHEVTQCPILQYWGIRSQSIGLLFIVDLEYLKTFQILEIKLKFCLLQGHFEILSLSGSFMPTDSGGTKSRAGGMSVSLAGPDGRVLGGGLAGMLIAAGPVQVRYCNMILN